VLFRSRHGAKLLYAYTEASVPKITIILRKAYGDGYIAMCSSQLGTDFVFARPSAEVGVMGPEGAAKLVFRKKITEAADPIEKPMSVDNLFVFLALFGYLAVAPANQHRVLFWGILGAILTPGLFIFGGVALLTHFHWLIYPLGAVLVFTGARLALGGGTEVHPEKNPIIRFASRVLPFTREYHGEAFAVIGDQGLRFTPLVLVLIAIETTDIVLAVDSVPAALAVSRDAFVIFTSNTFAILGLRARYFVLAGTVLTLRFLRHALAIILVLIGLKMMLARWVEVPTSASLIGVATILGGTIGLSLLLPGKRGDP